MTQLIPCLLAVLTGTYTGGIFLATPPHVTAQYLELLALSLRKPYLVLAEKPWAPSLSAFKRLARLLRNSPLTVRFIDHYLARDVVVNWLFQQPLTFFLGGPIIAIKGHLFEQSGAASPAMGVGVLRDLCVHLISVVSRLFPADRIELRQVWAARHDGWPFPPTASYVRLIGHIDTLCHRVSVNLAAAKNYPTAAKLLVLEGPEGTLYVDLAAETADLILRDGSKHRLYPDSRRPTTQEHPYVNIFRRVIEGDKSLGLNASEAEKVLLVLDQAEKLMPPLCLHANGTYPPDTTL
jgi:predicted dehydrogenase